MRVAIALEELYESHIKSSFLGIYWAAVHSLASAGLVDLEFVQERALSSLQKVIPVCMRESY